jgi:two-component system chemotaxis response regulator CheY
MEPINVLVVDDVQVMRSLLISSLRSLNVTKVQEAHDAQSALQIFAKGKIDIVFLDINMPDINGLELIKQLRSLNPSVFIIMVSGESSLDNVKQSIALGAKGFIVKPYTSGRIKAMIDKYKSENPVDLSS